MLDVKLKLSQGHTTERRWMEPSPLKQLFWNVTYACNYRCGICFSDSGTGAADELNTEEAMDMVRDAHESGVKDIIFSGGEPFIRKDLVDVLERMASVGMTARVASNGSLVTEELLNQLRERTLLKSFQISVDTLDPEFYSAFHGVPDGSLEHILAVLRMIQDHGFHTTISVRLTPETLPGIPDLLERASQEGWATVTVHLPLHTGRARHAYPQETDFLALLEPTFQKFCELEDKWLIETYIPWAPYHPGMRRLEKQVRVIHRGCRAGRDRLTVNPDGAITPCVCMDVAEARLGNVRTHSLGDVFRESSLCQLLRSPWDHGICTDCPEVTTCGAGCRAAAYGCTGTLNGLDLSCPVRKSRMKAASVKSGGNG